MRELVDAFQHPVSLGILVGLGVLIVGLAFWIQGTDPSMDDDESNHP